MPCLIGEVNNHEVSIEVDTDTFRAFNKYAKDIGRMYTKNELIGETFVAIRTEGKELNERSIKHHLNEKSIKKQPA